MEPSWKQADVFPIIARVIGEASQQHQGYVTAHEIATRLIQDCEARPLIEQVREQLGDPHSAEWLAGNMVAWFSQRITIGESECGRAVERVKIDGQWAYKPAAETASDPGHRQIPS
jgi:hypothetical protein